MSVAKEFVKKTLKENPLVVFSKSFCPFCNKAKELLTEGGYNPKVVELNKVENGSEIHSVVIEMSGLKTVPNVFVHGKSIGGSDDTKKLHESGKLKSMLQANE